MLASYLNLKLPCSPIFLPRCHLQITKCSIDCTRVLKRINFASTWLNDCCLWCCCRPSSFSHPSDGAFHSVTTGSIGYGLLALSLHFGGCFSLQLTASDIKNTLNKKRKKKTVENEQSEKKRSRVTILYLKTIPDDFEIVADKAA